MEKPREPPLEEIDERLDAALEETFPASDPVSVHPDSDPMEAGKEPPLPEDQADGGAGTGGPQAEP